MPRRRYKPAQQMYGNVLGRGRFRPLFSGRRRNITTARVGGRAFTKRPYGRAGGRITGRKRRTIKRRTKTYKRKRAKTARKVSRSAIVKALSETKVMTEQYGQQHTAAGYTGGGQGATYFTTEEQFSDNTNTIDKNTTITRVLDDIHHLKAIANKMWITRPQFLGPVAFPLSNFYSDADSLQIKSHVKYTIRNQSNEMIRIKAFHCIVRKDTKWTQPTTVSGVGQDESSNIYNVLGYGFAQRGLIVANQTANNAVLNELYWTPYQSQAFCETFKITKVKKLTLGSGGETQIALKKPWHNVKPTKLLEFIAGVNSGLDWTNSTNVRNKWSWVKGAKFILFQLESRIAGVAGQTTFSKDITFTTPTVIMHSIYTYKARHTPSRRHPHELLGTENSGLVNATPSIIVDEDEKKGTEIDAS